MSTLVAADTKIYRQSGYGLACPSYTMTMPRGATFRDVADSEELRVRFEDADLARHAPVVRAILGRDALPGTMAELSDAFMASHFADPEVLRKGHKRKRVAIVDDAHGAAAYAGFQRTLACSGSGGNGIGSTSQWAAVTQAASKRLWSVLLADDVRGLSASR